MGRFQYTAMDADGRDVAGAVEAASAEAAGEQLRSLGYESVRLLPVVPVAGTGAAAPPTSGTEALRADDLAEVGGRVLDVARAGLPLAAGLRALGSEIPSRRLRRTLLDLSGRLEAGEPLEQVLADSRSRIPEHLQWLILAGLRGDKLGVLLERYLELARAAVDQRRRVWLGMLYPVALLVAACGVLSIFLIWAVPQFRKIFEDFGTEMPSITRAVLDLSDLFVSGWPWMLSGLAVAVFSIPLIATLAGGGPARRRVLYAIPLVGGMWSDAALSRFCHLLGLLVGNGVPLPAALRMAGRGTADPLVEQVSRALAARVESGRRLTDTVPVVRPLSPLLAPVLRWETREEAFPDVLHGAGEVFGTRATVRASLVGILLEPLVVIGVAMTVGFIIIALFMPLIKLLNMLS